VVVSLEQAVQQDIAAELPRLQLDPARIRLLLRNLLDNALRHSTEAAQAPLLRLYATQAGGVELSVRDFGSGVPPEQLSQLAQAFYRPDAARTRDDGGVGLGLYLCKLVALAHGGTFTIENAHPGLLITVILPAPKLFETP
jgi:signal transduction histidine kinase